jgi:hypothetical protein
MPAVELMANNIFANGTSGWTAFSPTTAITAADRRLRATRILSNGINGCAVSNSGATVLVTQNAPHVARAFVYPGRNSAAMTPSVSVVGGVTEASLSSSAYGMLSVVCVPQGTSGYVVSVSDNVTTGVSAGDYYEVAYISLARCALVDNFPNLLLRSDEIDNAAWTKGGSSISPGGTDPTGLTGADAIIENSSTSQHYVTQSVSRASQAEDLCAFGYFKRASGTRNIRIYVGSSGTDYSACTFNLGSGTAGAITNSGSAINGRAFIVDKGNGYYYCAVVTRAAASVTFFTQFGLENGTSDNYAGNGTSSVYSWRLGAARSSVPTMGGQTTSAVTTGTAQTGSALYTKGWPSSTNGLLLVDDQVEIVTSLGSELKILTAPVNSDSAGLAYMQFEPPLRGTPADNAAIIVHQPMGRFIYTGESTGWDNDPGYFTSASCDFEEACGL